MRVSILNLPDTTPTFTWDPVPNANRYRVRIYNSHNNNTVWRGYTGNEPSYTVPPGILLPHTSYFYRIDTRDTHDPLDVDNMSKSPASSGDNFQFWTGEESADPFIELDSSGVSTWNDSFAGEHLSFWIKVHDVQGVPEDIESVKVTFPVSGDEEILYYRADRETTATSGIYASDSFLPIEDGTYTFTVTDRGGHVFITTEDFTSDPIGYPSETSLLPAHNTVVNDTAVDFDWEDVTGAAFYRVEIYDTDYNRIYAFATTDSQYSLPAGFLKENTFYRYRITTRREFFSENVDNGSSSPWSTSVTPTFMTTPVTGGPATPSMDLGDYGVSVLHIKKPGTDVSSYWLSFEANITDADGVPENIESVRVTYPGGIITRDLYLDNQKSASEGEYWGLEVFDDPVNIQAGTYTIRVTDFDGNWVELTDDLTVSALPVPTNCTPGQDSIVPGTTPTIGCDDVPGATRYKVRIYDAGGTLHWSDYLTVSSYTVPGGILEPDQVYSYRVYAYREEVPGVDIDNYSMDRLYSSERNHFTTTDDAGNNAPVVSDIPDQTIPEGSTFVTIALDNFVSDVDNTDAEITWTYSGNTALTVDIANRVATISIPDINWNGAETITFRATDPGSLFSEDAATFTVTSENDAPVASNGTLTTAEDTASGGTLVANDIDGNPLTYSIVGNGTKGTAAITNTATGAYTYTPNLDANGTDSFTFRAYDGQVNSNTATVSITITPVNDDPVANGGTLTMEEDTTSGGTLVATDADEDSLTYSIVGNGTIGTAAITNAATGAYTYTPNSNANGTDSFTFRAYDGQVNSNTATVNITVNNVNDTPLANDGTLTTDEDMVSGDTLVASDIDEDSLTYSIVSNGTIGTAAITNAATGAYTYTPDPNANGVDSFTFRVYDGQVNSNIATVDLAIIPVNDPPDTPTAITPADNETLPFGDVVLESSAFNDIDGDDLLNIHWKIRRIDQIAYIDEPTNDLTEFTVVGLDEGMKYAWQVGHQDPDEIISWSQEYTFRVGTSVTDSTLQIEPGIDVANFRMVSFVQWPDNLLAENAFGDSMAGDYAYNYRIGTYDPIGRGYIEYGYELIIEPGRAYWMVAREGMNPAIDGVPVSTPVPIYVRLAFNTSNQSGWNMIGCPNLKNYLWDGIEVIEYNESGDILASAAISDLPTPNDYIDMRLWRWANSSYWSDTAVMEAYEGYWVKVKKPNIYLCFTEAAQTELTNEDVPPASLRGVVTSEDEPPWPIGIVDQGDPNNENGGCFINSAATDSVNRGNMAAGICIFLILVYIFSAKGVVHPRGPK